MATQIASQSPSRESNINGAEKTTEDIRDGGHVQEEKKNQPSIITRIMGKLDLNLGILSMMFKYTQSMLQSGKQSLIRDLEELVHPSFLSHCKSLHFLSSISYSYTQKLPI